VRVLLAILLCLPASANSFRLGAQAERSFTVVAPVSGTPAAWTPAALGTNLALWLDADDASTITLNGSDVAQWNDKSGNDYHVVQGTASLQPRYEAAGMNGKPALNNEDGGFLLRGTTPMFRNVDGATIVAVYRATFPLAGGAAANGMLVAVNGGAITGATRLSLTTTGARHSFGGRRLDADGYTVVTSPTSLTADPTIWMGNADFANAQANTWLNGTADIAGAAFQAAGNTSDTNSFGIGLFNRFSGGLDTYDNTHVSEVLFIDATLSTDDRQKLEGYLAHKWGLTYALPNDHPYKWDTSLFGGINQDGFDADAKTYIAAVETSDGQDLEPSVRAAINDFVVGCKADDIWDAIKASAILAGARTLTGALVPLKGTAPTNFNFISGDYNRTTGLVGDGSTKWLNSNRSHLADPLNSVHLSVFQSTAFSAGVVIIGNSVIPRCAIYTAGWAIRTSTVTGSPATNATGFLGASRSTSGSYLVRTASSTISISSTSDSLSDDDNYGIYARTNGGYSNARLAFYSIGESLDLAQLDARVTTLINAYAAEIP
jgi:hypothetical protein